MPVPMEFKEGIAYLLKLEERYFDLVWYARKYPMDNPSWSSVPDDIRKEAFTRMMRVEEQYKEDVSLLGRQGYEDLTRGFHKGMLAGLRLATGILADDAETAKQDFPMLDT